jgi:hypothetical protein
MSAIESPARFHVRVRAAQLRMKVDRQLGRPSPDWIVALVEEGERREREQREAASG